MAAPERDQTAADARSASIFATAHAIRPQAGKVSTHAVTISRPTPHRTAESRRVLPTPKMAVLMVWVVLSGMPSREASSMVLAAAVSAAKPCSESSLVSRSPIVLTILQPPSAVPTPIVSAQSKMTHVGTRNSGSTPPRTSASVKTPDELLPVVGAVAERHERRREELQASEGAAQHAGSAPPEHPVHRERERQRAEESQARREHQSDEDRPPPLPEQNLGARGRKPGAG